MANKLTESELKKMRIAWQMSGNINEVARLCQVHPNTVRRYRKLEKWDDRKEELQRQITRQTEYTPSQAIAEDLTIVRALKAQLRRFIALIFNAEKPVSQAVLKELVKTFKELVMTEQMLLNRIDRSRETVRKPPKVVIIQIGEIRVPDIRLQSASNPKEIC